MKKGLIPIAVALLIATTIVTPVTHAAGNTEFIHKYYSDGPEKYDKKLDEFKKEAYFEDLNGNKIKTQIVSDDEFTGQKEFSDSTNSGGITPQFTEDYGTYIYQYNWKYYVPNYDSYSMYKFYKGQVTFQNASSSTQLVPLSYSQTSSVQSVWTTTGRIEAEAGFKVSVLAEMKAKVGLEVSYQHTSYTGETIGATVHVPAGRTGYIYRYKAGQYTGGSGAWDKWKIVKATGQSTNLGIYYETGNAWGIIGSDDHWKGGDVANGAPLPPK